MKYYEITPESPAYKISKKLWDMPSVWNKATKDIEELLGCNPWGNLRYKSTVLLLSTLENIPDEIKSQFSKNKNRNEADS